ncbi:protein-L-isoaspartate(D-aspartate) O-methyltransferase [Methylonatrum kenyense]|uniref:protein-L-isoaspartate(D-aspartate) O-methyltransferase n=1 Tax=Methylonatrum kenyense TaxID=455253 RepID=UPI00202B0845|nr:protein-L-isoaspartate(D-aspartate) O-methyltransferase [Methylonatrum kenyense]MCK8516405.1 protein-L-isoaspartate(D-aspartate) O-methyltransferase [Methylonatrum kenyense]
MSVLMHGIGMTSKRTRERLLKRLREKGISNEQVLDVMRVVPRHLFVDEALASRAYDDTALPIGYGQTISQPWVVARMTEALIEGGCPESVLEIGTGSGYQAAILGCLVDQVYTLERIRALAALARERMRRFGLKNVHVRYGDGFRGWAAHGPFQAILLTAAPAGVPDELFQQLADGGRLIAPVGSRDVQELIRVTRRGDRLEREVLDRVVFVPMLGGTQ